jgi:hypothetical protein
MWLQVILFHCFAAVVSSAAFFAFLIAVRVMFLFYYFIFLQPLSYYWAPWIVVALRECATQHVNDVPVRCLAFKLSRYGEDPNGC